MTKFLMTVDIDDVPIAINTDMIVAVEECTKGCYVLTTKRNYMLKDSYVSVVKKLTPFVPFEDMQELNGGSKWLQDYLERITVDANYNNG